MDEAKAVEVPAVEEKKDPISPFINVNGKIVDMRKVLPLTLGDFRRLKRDHNIEQLDLGKGDIEVTAKFTLFLLSKADPSVTEADVDMLTMADLDGVMRALGTKEFTVIDRPTSAESTSSV